MDLERVLQTAALVILMLIVSTASAFAIIEFRAQSFDHQAKGLEPTLDGVTGFESSSISEIWRHSYSLQQFLFL